MAISLEEDDARIYGDYADRLKADYPATAELQIMQDEELVHAQRLMDTWRAQFGEHIPFIQWNSLPSHGSGTNGPQRSRLTGGSSPFWRPRETA